MSAPVVTDDEVFAIVQGALARVLELDPAGITRATPLASDPAVDSLVLVETVELVETELQRRLAAFTIDDDDVEDLATVDDAVRYVVGRVAVAAVGPEARAGSTRTSRRGKLRP